MSLTEASTGMGKPPAESSYVSRACNRSAREISPIEAPSLCRKRNRLISEPLQAPDHHLACERRAAAIRRRRDKRARKDDSSVTSSSVTGESLGSPSEGTSGESVGDVLQGVHEKLASQHGSQDYPSFLSLSRDVGASDSVSGRQPGQSTANWCNVGYWDDGGPSFGWPTHGFVSVCGKRHAMEDSVAAFPAFMHLSKDKDIKKNVSAAATILQHSSDGAADDALHFFGVYDGHGGAQASKFCSERFHVVLSEELKQQLTNETGKKEGSEHWTGMERALSETFLRIDAEVCGQCRNPWHQKHKGNCGHKVVAPDAVGTTAVVAVVSNREILVGNCGDSRAVLCRGGTAIPLSSDHKPERPDELQRINASGGQVVFSDAYRVFGILAMSRAIGDKLLKPFITPEPELTHTFRSSDDEFILMASDGLWDVVSNELACDIVRRCLANHKKAHPSGDELNGSACSMAAALLAKLALSRGSGDNISVVVVNLQSKPKLL